MSSGQGWLNDDGTPAAFGVTTTTYRDFNGDVVRNVGPYLRIDQRPEGTYELHTSLADGSVLALAVNGSGKSSGGGFLKTDLGRAIAGAATFGGTEYARIAERNLPDDAKQAILRQANAAAPGVLKEVAPAVKGLVPDGLLDGLKAQFGGLADSLKSAAAAAKGSDAAQGLLSALGSLGFKLSAPGAADSAPLPSSQPAAAAPAGRWSPAQLAAAVIIPGGLAYGAWLLWKRFRKR